MGIGRILLSPQHFFHTPNLLQLPLNHPPCCPPTHAHLHTGPQGCFVHCWNVCVELCVRPPPNPHHVHHAKTQSPCICTLALEAPSCLVGALTMCPPPPINLRQHSALHPHLRTHSEPGCTATVGRACPSMFPFAWRNFHHKPALVAPIILWLEYFLCAHHTNFPNFQLPGTHADPPGPAFLPTWPFTACAPPSAPFRTPPCTSVHLHTPLCTFAHPCAHLCAPLHTSAHLCAPPHTPAQLLRGGVQRCTEVCARVRKGAQRC